MFPSLSRVQVAPDQNRDNRSASQALVPSLIPDADEEMIDITKVSGPLLLPLQQGPETQLSHLLGSQ